MITKEITALHSQHDTVKGKNALRYRHELKYNLNPFEDRIVTHRLSNLFVHDKYADSHGTYRVSSLYFDTPYDKALREKTDGVNKREKFRIRYYNDDTSFIRLEKKIKSNGLCAKKSTKLTLEQTTRIIRGDIDFLLHSEDPLLIEFYSKIKGQLLRPKTIVCYDREAFLYSPGNVRVTLDRNLRTCLSCVDFFNPNLHFFNISEKITVLEVKYDAFLPDIVRTAVQVPNRQSSAYSKYAFCRHFD